MKLSSEQMKIITLHRYFIWANKMRTDFDQLLTQNPKSEYWEMEINIYMSYWYGGLFVVIEGWKELNLSDPIIDRLLSSTNVDLLRLYRNSVFHFQPKYWNKKFLGFIQDGHGAVVWVRTLNQEFGRFFLEWCNQRRLEGYGQDDVSPT